MPMLSWMRKGFANFTCLFHTKWFITRTESNCCRPLSSTKEYNSIHWKPIHSATIQQHATMVFLSNTEPTSSFDRGLPIKSRGKSLGSIKDDKSFTMSNRYSFYTPSAVDAATVNKSKTKRTSAPQPQQQQQQQPNKQTEKRLALTQKLTTFARGCDRRQILRLLGSPQYTKMYTLKGCRVEDIAMAEREASGERGILNGVKFLQVRGSGVGEFVFVLFLLGIG